MSASLKATTTESLLLLSFPGTFTSLYYNRSTPLKGRPYNELSEQLASGLCIIPTSFIDETWLDLSESEIEERMIKLGGFPVIVKTLGLSHGQGVMKVDSSTEFAAVIRKATLTDYKTIVRKYLADYRHYRLIVIENEVVAAIEYHKPNDDFRTNAATPVVSGLVVSEIPEQILTLATKSANLRTSLLAGVDVLIDQTDNIAYLAEVNAPCYFARAEKPTGIDIAGKIIEALCAKQAKGKA
jgi:glutathione synthase/RimK-type ligase-like ATP-grasp enzyme